MHAIHTTSGFVVGSKSYGEADKVLFIFTKDFGLISVIANGIRLEKSKLRYFTQDYSCGSFSVVRGREFWRLTSAGEEVVVKADQEIIKRAALMLRRFLQGEDPHPQLFETIFELFTFLQKELELSAEQKRCLESIVVYRIMHSLGYIGLDGGIDEIVKTGVLSVELIDSLISKRILLNKHINTAIKESQL